MAGAPVVVEAHICTDREIMLVAVQRVWQDVSATSILNRISNVTLGYGKYTMLPISVEGLHEQP